MINTPVKCSSGNKGTENNFLFFFRSYMYEKGNCDMSPIFLARHCKTDWNLQGKLQGTQDVPLCAVGRDEARINVENIKPYQFSRIITSPALRAQQTALIYAQELEIPYQTHVGLRELDHGIWEGNHIETMLKDPSCDYCKWLQDPTEVPLQKSGETINKAQQRVNETIQSISKAYPKERILIIMHKHIRAILSCALWGISLSNFKDQIEETISPMKISQSQLGRILKK
jgi:broad specificity phosphatase PhoE